MDELITELDISLDDSVNDAVEILENPIETGVYIPEEEIASVEIPETLIIDDVVSDQQVETVPDIVTPLLSGEGESGASDTLSPSTEALSTPSNELNLETVESELEKIYQILEERIPENVETEAQSEEPEEVITQVDTEVVVPETEVTLSDLRDILQNIESYESELVANVHEVRRNQYASDNNRNNFDTAILAAVSAVWGAFIIFLFFRKIG